MTIPQLIKWLKQNSSGIYRPANEAADRMETMAKALTQLANCNLNEDNCGSLEVATKRVRNVASIGLK
jgi:hypothetical protein